MEQRELEAAIGKKVCVLGHPWITMNEEMKHLNGKHCTVIKQCKSGLLLVEVDGKQYSIPMHCLEIVVSVPKRFAILTTDADGKTCFTPEGRLLAQQMLGIDPL